jgi:hypothetical protein
VISVQQDFAASKSTRAWSKGIGKTSFSAHGPGFPARGATDEHNAALIVEIRMKFVNARELDRKSGCTLGRTWGTRPEP